MVRANYLEGDWFAVPLREGGYAVGLVARASRDGVMLGYFFGPQRVALPALEDVNDLAPDEAIFVGKFGHLGLKQGRWPILGRLESWNRAAWPMPTFIRYEELTGRSFRVIYDDADPSMVVREEVILPGIAEQAPKDGLMGAGFVERVLTAAMS